MANTITEKLRAALSSKERIRQAIETKGISCDESVPFSEYGDKILSISEGGSGHITYGMVSPGIPILGRVINISGIGIYELNQ